MIDPLLQPIPLPLTHDMISPYMERGLIRCRKQGSLTIYSYTHQCQKEQAWDAVTLQCRGLILDEDSKVIARPWSKFFNLGEAACEHPLNLPDLPYTIYSKIDGSLLIAFWYEGKWRFATRGSFANAYTEYAAEFLSLLSPFPLDYTVLFEVVPPPDSDGLPRVVLHKPGIYLLGAVHTDTGRDIDPFELFNCYWREPLRATWDARDLAAILKAAETDTETEGWVIRFLNGYRIKVKTAWYLRLFRAINNLTETNIREMMAMNPTTLSSPNEIAGEFPEEFRKEVLRIVQVVDEGIKKRYQNLLRQFTEIKARLGISPGTFMLKPEARKRFAIDVSLNPEKGLLFSLLDGKPILKQLLLDESQVYYASNESLRSDNP